MDKYTAEYVLRDLDDLSKQNLACDPPRITNQAMLAAIKAAKFSGDYDIAEMEAGSIPTRSMMYLADELNDLINAAFVLREQKPANLSGVPKDRTGDAD